MKPALLFSATVLLLPVSLFASGPSRPEDARAANQAGAAAAAGPPAALSLEEAIALAGSKSEQVAVAEAGVARARGERMRARAERFPQLSLTASYDRTLETEFEGLFDATAGDDEDGVDFSRLPFGRKNIWRVAGVSYTGENTMLPWPVVILWLV